MAAKVVLAVTLSCIFYQAFFHIFWSAYFPPASWAVLSACIWTSCVFVRGWNNLGVWDKRQFLWGALSCLWFLNFLQTSKGFQSWGDVYFFCGRHMEYCTCDFRWNLHGWAKAAVLWNFVLSAALGMQRLAIQLGLCGLLPGEEVVTRESFISICWRLIPYWLNNWEQQWGAECSSMMFELPHFAVELLVILPCVQILCSRMKILAVPHPGLPQDAEQDPLRENYAPNILKGHWEHSPGQKKFMQRLRSNTRIMTFTVAISALAAFNALSMPLQLERQILNHPHAATTLLSGRSLNALNSLPRMDPKHQRLTPPQAYYAHTNRPAVHKHPTHHAAHPVPLATPRQSETLQQASAMQYSNSSAVPSGQEQPQQVPVAVQAPASGAVQQVALQQPGMQPPAMQQPGPSGVQAIEARPPPGTALLPLGWLMGLFQEDCDTIFCLITGIKFVPIDGPPLPPGMHNPGRLDLAYAAAGAAFGSQGGAAGPVSAMPTDYRPIKHHGMSLAPADHPLASHHEAARSYAAIPPSHHHHTDPATSASAHPTSPAPPLSNKTPPPPVPPTTEEINKKLQLYMQRLHNDTSAVASRLQQLLDSDPNAFAQEYLRMFALHRRRNPAPPKELLQDTKQLLIYPRLRTYSKSCPSLAQLKRTLEKHSNEISKMQDPEHKILIPLVESALAVMRLSCEKFFVLVTVFVAYILFREPPPVARFIIRLNSRLSTTFQRIILYSFPAVCWIYGAGFIFSTFVSIVFWGGPVLLFYESFRNAISVVCIKSLKPSIPEEVDRMGGNCAICWGEMHACAHPVPDPEEPGAASTPPPPQGSDNASVAKTTSPPTFPTSSTTDTATTPATDVAATDAAAIDGVTEAAVAADAMVNAAATDAATTDAAAYDAAATTEEAAIPRPDIFTPAIPDAAAPAAQADSLTNTPPAQAVSAGPATGFPATEPPAAQPSGQEDAAGMQPQGLVGDEARLGVESLDMVAAAAAAAMEGHSLPCGHAYHHACLTQWLHQCHAQSIAPTCPMCQQSIQLEVRWRFPIPWRNPYAALAVDFDQQRGGGAAGAPDGGMAGLLDHQRELQELLQDMPQIMAPEGFRDQLEVLQQQMLDDAGWPELVPMAEQPEPPPAPVPEPAEDNEADVNQPGPQPAADTRPALTPDFEPGHDAAASTPTQPSASTSTSSPITPETISQDGTAVHLLSLASSSEAAGTPGRNPSGNPGGAPSALPFAHLGAARDSSTARTADTSLGPLSSSSSAGVGTGQSMLQVGVRETGPVGGSSNAAGNARSTGAFGTIVAGLDTSGELEGELDGRTDDVRSVDLVAASSASKSCTLGGGTARGEGHVTGVSTAGSGGGGTAAQLLNSLNTPSHSAGKG